MPSVLRVKADLSSLPAVREHVLANARRTTLPDGTEHKIDLVIEELLVNIANHAYGGNGGPMEVECMVRDSAFCCLIRDWGPPFNPLNADYPPSTKPLKTDPSAALAFFWPLPCRITVPTPGVTT